MVRVSLPTQLRQMLCDPGFWAEYFFASDPYLYEGSGRPPTRSVPFPVGDGHELRLDVQDTGFALRLRPAGDPFDVVLGWDDEDHPFPYVVRWEELDLLCRAAALLDPELRHPGPMLALLGRFLLIANHDDIAVIQAMLHAALTGAGVEESTKPWVDAWPILARSDFQREAVLWQRDADGNHLVCQDRSFGGRHLHTLRWGVGSKTREQFPWADCKLSWWPNEGFPWVEWRELLGQAERTVATAIDSRWLTDRGAAKLLDRAVAGRDLSAAPELADALATAGCDNKTVLSALADPIDTLETLWVLELLTTAPRGSLVAALLDRSATPVEVSQHWRAYLRPHHPAPTPT
jgi:hypothetical protein